jgi:hypothetical protein
MFVKMEVRDFLNEESGIMETLLTLIQDITGSNLGLLAG